MGLVVDSLKGLMDHNHVDLVAVDPAGADEGDTIINTTDNGYKIYYSGAWQTIFTLTVFGTSLLLFEDGDTIQTEDGFDLEIN